VKVVCAWCQFDMGTKEGPKDIVSHGMCDRCYEDMSGAFDEVKSRQEERGTIVDQGILKG